MTDQVQATELLSSDHVETITKPSQLREIKDGDQFSADTVYNGDKTVTGVFSIRRFAGGPRYEKRCIFDFSGVTEEQLYLLAMYGVKVKVQSLLRDMSEDVMLDPKTLSTVDVQVDVVEAERQSADLATQLQRVMRRAGVSADIVQEALAQVAKK
jgi:hypothetical protein